MLILAAHTASSDLRGCGDHHSELGDLTTSQVPSAISIRGFDIRVARADFEGELSVRTRPPLTANKVPANWG